MLNLISNALKFTPAGGQVNVIARAQGAMLEIIVADTGVGIARADLERLGRPYEQAGGIDQRSMGTGLGLSLVRAFAELHGGDDDHQQPAGRRHRGQHPAAGDGSGGAPGPATRAGRAAGAPSPPPLAVAAGDNVIAFRPQR